jgi:hypothetical protein
VRPQEVLESVDIALTSEDIAIQVLNSLSALSLSLCSLSLSLSLSTLMSLLL